MPLIIGFKIGKSQIIIIMANKFHPELYRHLLRIKVLLKSAFVDRKRWLGGFTLIELMVVMAIVGILSGIGIPAYRSYIEKAKITKVISEIHLLEKEILAYAADGTLPDTLDDIGRGNLLDAWGNPYQYLNFENVQGQGQKRKDHNMVPINDFFDLYSMGKDGKSSSPLTAKASHDDIIRAYDGQYVGIASAL